MALSGVFRLNAAFGATRPSTCLGALPIVSTAEARAAEGASPKVTWPHSLLVADLVLSLLVEPNILEAPIIIDRVLVQYETL